jgi:hypothetical protein
MAVRAELHNMAPVALFRICPSFNRVKISKISFMHVQIYTAALLMTFYAKSVVMAAFAGNRRRLRLGFMLRNPVHLVIFRLHRPFCMAPRTIFRSIIKPL